MHCGTLWRELAVLGGARSCDSSELVSVVDDEQQKFVGMVDVLDLVVYALRYDGVFYLYLAQHVDECYADALFTFVYFFAPSE